MTPSFVTPMPFRIVAPSILIARPGLPECEIERADRVDVDRVERIALDRAAERMVQREPSRVTPIHLLVCTEPSGLISETKPSFSATFCALPAFIATMRLRFGS